MIIGREKEIRILNELYRSGKSELVAICGRRRVGKTFLVDEVFKNKITFRHAGLSPIDDRYDPTAGNKKRTRNQLIHFCRSLEQQGEKEQKKPESWLEAFYLLEEFLKEKDDGESRIVVFLDEIQWIGTPRSGFITGFEAFWNSWACHRKNIMVIVCGSSSSWIQDKLIHNHGGLYGRVTYEISLAPFSLYECEKYFKSKGIETGRYEIVHIYMMTGGIPYYLNYFDRELSFYQNIDAMFFEEHAPLRNEFNHLFSLLFDDPDSCKSVITVLSTNNIGMTKDELLQKTDFSTDSSLAVHLKTLINSNFIIKYHSFGDKNKAFYKLVDPFCNFYLRFMNVWKGPKIRNWLNVMNSPSVKTWKEQAFVNVCFSHIQQIRTALGISGSPTYESLWPIRDIEGQLETQTDLIISRRDNIINMCEIKFCCDVFGADKDYQLILEQRTKRLYEIIPKNTAVRKTLITTFGLNSSIFYYDFINVVTLDDLFHA